jgi:hypothetical protein
MDTTKIVEKALKGEDYSVDIKDFSDEDKTKVTIAIRDAADVAAKANLAKLAGTGKEIQRREEKEKNEAKEDQVFQTFASEQLAEAKKTFYSNPDYPLTDAQKAQVEAEFKTNKVDAKLIAEDLKKFYVSLDPDKFLKASKRATELEKGAAQFNAGAAGGPSNTGAPGDESKYTPAAKNLFSMWRQQGLTKKTLDDAQKLVNRGFDWQKRDLSK